MPTFGLMLWAAIVIGAVVADRAFKRAQVTADAVGMVAFAAVAGIVGAKLWHVMDSPSEFRGWSGLWDTAGFAWYGGLIFGIAALVLQGVREDRGVADTGFDGTGGGDWVRSGKDRVLSLGRRMLRD